MRLVKRIIGTRAVAVASIVLTAGFLAEAVPAGAAVSQGVTELGCLSDLASNPCPSSAVGLASVRAVVISPDGKNAYAVASGTTGGLTTYDRDPSTGALTQKPGVTGCIWDAAATSSCANDPSGALNSPFGVAISPDGQFVYTSASGNSAIAIFRRDTTTGVLTETGCVKAFTSTATCGTSVASLSQLLAIAISPDGKSLYATTQAPNHALTTLSRDATTGNLTFSSCVRDPSGSTVACALGSGLLTSKSIVVSPDGANVYLAAQASNAVDVFTRNPTTGDLTQTACLQDSSTLTTGCNSIGAFNNPLGIAVSPDGTSVYASAEASGLVDNFSRGAAGALTLAGCVAATSTAGCATATALGGPWGLAVSSDNASLYVAASTSNAIAAFDRASDGSLTQKPLPGGCVVNGAAGACNGGNALGQPLAVTVAPDGHHVYAASFGSDALDILTLAPSCQNVSASTTAGTSVSVPLSCVTAGGNTMTLSVASAPAHGSLGPISANQVTYTPAPGYSGADSFTYQATEPAGISSLPATAAITVQVPPTTTVTTPGPGPPPPPPPPPPGLPAPRAGHTVNLYLRLGRVLVRLPGSPRFVVLTSSMQVPVGTVIDTTHGTVSLCSAADARGDVQCADFYEGIFRVTQAHPPLTDLRLVGPLDGCRAHRARHASAHLARARAHHVERHLWGNGHGNFRTSGSYALAAVRGTFWLVQDHCDRTVVRVRRGVVAVRDVVRRRTVFVRAGHAYAAQARRRP